MRGEGDGQEVLKGSICEAPTLAIVTIVKDDPAGLIATCSSLALVSPRSRVEAIVWIKQPGIQERAILDQIAPLVDTIVIGEDHGIFDAMNRALGHVRSDLCLFLNARDTIVEPLDVAEITGPCLIRVRYRDYFGHLRLVRPNPTIKFGIPYCHQGMILPSDKCRFDPQLRFGGDYQFLVQSGVKWPLPILDCGLVHYDTDGVSTVNRWASDRWTAHVIARQFGWLWATAYVIKAIGKLGIKRVYDLWCVVRSIGDSRK